MGALKAEARRVGVEAVGTQVYVAKDGVEAHPTQKLANARAEGRRALDQCAEGDGGKALARDPVNAGVIERGRVVRRVAREEVAWYARGVKRDGTAAGRRRIYVNEAGVYAKALDTLKRVCAERVLSYARQKRG